MRPCRSIPALALLLGLALPLSLGLSGCFVFEELSKGQEIMDKHGMGGSGKAETEEPPSTARRGEGDEGAPRKSLWEGGRTLDPKERDGDIARCTLGGSVQFMRKSDCLARGGTP